MKASRNVTVAMTAAARGRSPVAAVAEVREAIAVDLAPVVALAARAMTSEAREDLIRIAAAREAPVVAADSVVRARVVDVPRSAATTTVIADRVRLNRRARSW